MDQLVASWEESAREGDPPGGKNVLDFQHHFLTFVDFPAYGWRSSRCRFFMILVSLESLQCILRSVTNLARSRAWDCEIRPREQRLPECFSIMESHFPIEIPAKLGKHLAIWELHVVAKITLFLKVSNLHTNSSWVRKTLCTNIAPKMGYFGQ